MQAQLDVLIMKYTELIINQKIPEMEKLFDPNNARTNRSCKLFKYENQKRCEGYETDWDLVPKSFRKERKRKIVASA